MGLSAKSPAKSIPGIETITVFITGNGLGVLKPCGCSGGQLGGFARRAAVLNSVSESKRLIIDTGSLIEGSSEQDLIKFNIEIEDLNLLGYDVVNLTESDAGTAKTLDFLADMGSFFSIISPKKDENFKFSTKFTKKFALKGSKIEVTVATFDVEATPIEQLGDVFFENSTDIKAINILIVNQCNEEIIDAVSKLGNIDCLVCPSESDEPELIGSLNNSHSPGIVMTVGRYGRYVVKLEIREVKGTGNLKTIFSAVPVTEDLPSEARLVALYKDYQRIVKHSNLLERMPKFVLPDGLEYKGSKSCKSCHDYEYTKWSTKRHADAYATLEKVGSQFDPECVSCHVVGMEYESGFVSETKSGHLKDVGCENCHGPGSDHISSLGKTKTVEPKSVCGDCHTPEHSGDYLANEQRYFEKIIHWREPNVPSNVKGK